MILTLIWMMLWGLVIFAELLFKSIAMLFVLAEEYGSKIWIIFVIFVIIIIALSAN